MWFFCVSRRNFGARLRGFVSDGFGRALEWHSRGQRFDPAYLHHLRRESSLGRSLENTMFSRLFRLSIKSNSRLSSFRHGERILAGHAESCWADRPKLLDFNASGNSLHGSITLRGPQAESPHCRKTSFSTS